MPKDGEQNEGKELYRVGIRVPPFYPQKPALWFAQLESQFVLSNISADETKLHYAFGQLDPAYAVEVEDVITSSTFANFNFLLNLKLVTPSMNVSAIYVIMTSSSLPQAFEQRVIQPASIYGYYGYPDTKHAADAHSWSSPTAFAATLAQHTALRPVSKQRRTSLLVDAAASHYAALHRQTDPTHRELCGI
ncbi:unnamed protein product [Euphydryas editha]|uniref:DUF7041 domain-containing protein n=1 Tax=Euphydryas editha TaxID=104508 RepID=A0AAU9TYB1_EUPED|nr:unnamed protein product [Euphydryas editha]